MGVSSRHIVEQRRVIGALVRTVARGAMHKEKSTPALPGPVLSATVPALPNDLVGDFVRLVGGDRASYKKHVPAHLFPQWSFPLIAQALERVPYPPARLVNAGCTLEVLRDLPRGEPLEVSAQLVDIDDNGRRAIMTVRVKTGTRTVPEALVADFRALAPLKQKSGQDGPKGNGKARRADDKPRVASEAREVARFRFSKHAGLDFAKVTGDFNPIHWLPSYARAMGFSNVILHGFGSMSWSFEGLARGLFSGDVRRIKKLDANFTRPLVLPGEVGLYVWGDRQVGLGDAPGGPAYMTGSFEVRSS